MILLLPPQLSYQAKQHIEMSAELHGIKNPTVTELSRDTAWPDWRRFEIVEGDVTPPPIDAGQTKITQGPHSP